MLGPLAVILVLMFLLQFSGQGAVTFYTALIFREARSSIDPNDCALVIGVTYFVSSILGLVLKKHVGRRSLLLLSEMGMAVSQISLGLYFFNLYQVRRDLDLVNSSDALEDGGNGTSLTTATDINTISTTTTTSTTTLPSSSMLLFPADGEDLLADNELLGWLPLPLLITFTVAFNIGMGSLTWVVATEVLPVRSRRWTHAVANVTSNLWWFVVTKTFKDVYRELGPHVPFLLYGSVCLFGFVFIYVFLPETQGKSADETAAAFSGFRPILGRVGFGRNPRGRCRRRPAGSSSTAAASAGASSPSAAAGQEMRSAIMAAPVSTSPESELVFPADLELRPTAAVADAVEATNNGASSRHTGRPPGGTGGGGGGRSLGPRGGARGPGTEVGSPD